MAELESILAAWNEEFQIPEPIAQRMKSDYLAQLKKIYEPQTPAEAREELLSLAKTLYKTSALWAQAKYDVLLAFSPTDGKVH